MTMTILNGARALLATVAPLTGHRAGGTATVKATAGTVTIPRNSYAIPVIARHLQPDLLVKTEVGPNADGSWTATVGGTAISFVSNVGGTRHNLPVNTPLVFDPPIVGVASATVGTAWAGGADPTGADPLYSAVIYEDLPEGVQTMLAKSPTTAFPALVLTWGGEDPADGGNASTRSRAGRGSTSDVLMKDLFLASVFVSRLDSDTLRRSDGLSLVEHLQSLWTDRRSVDGQVFSAPGGVMVQRSLRAPNRAAEYQRWHVYQIALAVTRTLSRQDDRTYYDFDHALIDGISPQDPPLPHQGDLTVVDDVLVNL